MRCAMPRGEPAAADQRHRVPRSRAEPAPARRAPSCIRSTLVPAAPLTKAERRDPRRRARARSAESPAITLERRRAARSTWRAAGDFSPYTLRLVASAGVARAAGGHRPGAGADRVQLQGRLPERLRLQPDDACPPEPARRSGDRLPGARLRELPPPDARSALGA